MLDVVGEREKWASVFDSGSNSSCNSMSKVFLIIDRRCWIRLQACGYCAAICSRSSESANTTPSSICAADK